MEYKALPHMGNGQDLAQKKRLAQTGFNRISSPRSIEEHSIAQTNHFSLLNKILVVKTQIKGNPAQFRSDHRPSMHYAYIIQSSLHIFIFFFANKAHYIYYKY